jgi:dihydrofolate synthase/folylpolyglutamate synthase
MTPSSRHHPSFRFRTVREAEDYLLGFINYEQLTRYRPTTRTHDLARFARLLRELGWEPGAVPTVHIGGTNGKGTLAFLLERILRAAGVRTGLYTSPHLQDIRERIRIGGRLLGAAAFREGVERLARAYAGEPRAGFRTTFEHLTALAFLAFQERRVERAVVEVGLGGRLDATNVLPPGPAVLTPVSFDHRRVLGSTVRAIAADKAHILKPGGTAFLMPQSPSAARAVTRRTGRLGIPVVATRGAVVVEPVGVGPEGTEFALRGRHDYGTVSTRLLGRHQVENVRAAVAVAEHLVSGSELARAVRRGLAGAGIPGRLEPVRVGGTWFLVDGGHNPAAGRAMAAAIDRHYPGARTAAVVGMAEDKAHGAFLRVLEPVVETFVFTRAPSPRAVDPERLAQRTRGRCRTAPDVEAALEVTGGLGAEVVLVTGSFLVAGEARRVLGLTVA